jgi:hypothetical protein
MYALIRSLGSRFLMVGRSVQSVSGEYAVCADDVMGPGSDQETVKSDYVAEDDTVVEKGGSGLVAMGAEHMWAICCAPCR